MTGIYAPVTLLAKDDDDGIVDWGETVFLPGTISVPHEPAYERLSELFTVNHYIVSQANPILIPFVNRIPPPEAAHGWIVLRKLKRLVASEVRHRLEQLEYFRLLPTFLKTILNERTSGNVTVTPDLSLDDFLQLLSNPTHESLCYWILKGERSVWPLLPSIRNRCAIERALDRDFLYLAKKTPRIPLGPSLLHQRKT